jgi:hypothetical protein
MGSERLFLTVQAANARTAMMQTLTEMKTTVVRVADVRSCAQHHPWLVTGSVVAAGFVTGAAMTHSPRKKVRTAPLAAETLERPGLHDQTPPRTETASWLSTVGTALTASVITGLQAALTAAITAAFVKEQVSAGARPADADLNRGDFENGAE